MTRSGFRRFVGYACVGATGTIVQYVILAVLVSSRTCGVVAASCIGAVAGGVVNYLLNYHITFRATGSHRQTAPRFFAIAILGIVLNSALMFVLTHPSTMSWLPAQFITTASVLLLTYTASSLWTFRVHHG